MTVPRFHVPEAAPGSRVVLPEHTAHHAREVLRLRAGASAQVFDGSGREFQATLEEVTRQRVLVRLGGPVSPRPESTLRVVLALPPLKGDRMELVVQKATELGTAEVWPVVTARTDAAGRPALHGSRHERWERVASGAAEQCGRAVVPRIAPTTTLDSLLGRPFDGRKLLFLAATDAPPLPGSDASPGSVLALIGPAGGWEESEVSSLRRAGFETLSLGPRTLRSETAAIAAVTCLQALWGDLGPRRRW